MSLQLGRPGKVSFFNHPHQLQLLSAFMKRGFAGCSFSSNKQDEEGKNYVKSGLERFHILIWRYP